VTVLSDDDKKLLAARYLTTFPRILTRGDQAAVAMTVGLSVEQVSGMVGAAIQHKTYYELLKKEGFSESQIPLWFRRSKDQDPPKEALERLEAPPGARTQALNVRIGVVFNMGMILGRRACNDKEF
jgi:hypothetical protein